MKLPEIANWYKAYKAPVVLMIDDLSDAYIEKYSHIPLNDWGYLTDSADSAFNFLKKELLDLFPRIKITFFVPYGRHAVINDKSGLPCMKYAVGERAEFSDFLQKLLHDGHELAHHGSTHGQYVDPACLSTGINWKDEWELFKEIKQGVSVTMEGVLLFNKLLNYKINGGKYCGYAFNKIADTIIDQCKLRYWCRKANYYKSDVINNTFGKNKVLDFPTNVPGNAFNRFKYKTEDKRKDFVKSFTKFLQPFYNKVVKRKLKELYVSGSVISIQEHYSPSTTRGIIQSSNISSDIASLCMIYSLLNHLDIWYATCVDIANYAYVRNNSRIDYMGNGNIMITFDDPNDVGDMVISLSCCKPFFIQDNCNKYYSESRGVVHYVNLYISPGDNYYFI